MNLRSQRSILGLSQSRLARLSGVSRFKLCSFELGSGSLTSDELSRIGNAIEVEADRLRGLHLEIGVRQSEQEASAENVSSHFTASIVGGSDDDLR